MDDELVEAVAIFWKYYTHLDIEGRIGGEEESERVCEEG